MIFETTFPSGIGLLAALAESTGRGIKNGRLMLPDTFGEGYLQSFDLGPFMKMSINQCSLNEELILKRTGSQQGKKEITFSFRNVFPDHHGRVLPSVQVSSSDIDLEIVIPAKTKINTILIIVHVELLRGLLNQKNDNNLLKNIISGDQPYLYDEIISPEIQHIAAAIIDAKEPEQLGDFYLKLKAVELIYFFFVELVKRQNIASYPLNMADVKTMYLIRDQIAADLSVPPDLSELTRFSNMSESKMNRLFRQIFGNSVYHYYQGLRMHEAAYLIREEKLSVSEAGYRLGFTNLSHFSRVFERHMGLKPKKYSAIS